MTSHASRLAPHALMVGVMLTAMFGPWGALGSIGGAGILVCASIVCAPLARRDETFRAHILDLWAMAVLLLALLPASSGSGRMAMTATPSSGAMPMTRADGSGLALVPVILVWAALRGALAFFSTRHLHDAVTAVVTATGLVAMIAV